MYPARRALLAAFALVLSPLAAPHAVVLDGIRDPAYSLVAEDPLGDFIPAPGQAKFLWADLTRIYVAHDDANLYAYVDLPNYVVGSSSGEVGLAIVIPGETSAGSVDDPWSQGITYAFDQSHLGLCQPATFSTVRHPNFLIRGYLSNGATDDPLNANDGFTILTSRDQNVWQDTDFNWGGLGASQLVDHLAYANAAGVEFSIPWADLGLEAPTPLYLSFFTTALGADTPVFDTLPSDAHSGAVLTSTTLAHLAYMALPLRPPLSVSFGCAAITVPENAPSVAITATLSSPLTQTIAVSYTTTAAGASPSDFTPISGTLTFAPGTTQQALAVPLNNDTLPEASETFMVILSNPANVTLASPVTITVTITDDDAGHRLYLPNISR